MMLNVAHLEKLYDSLGEAKTALQKNLEQANRVKDDSWLRYKLHLEGKIAGVSLARSHVQQAMQEAKAAVLAMRS